MPKQVSVTEAHALMSQGSTYVDVRSRPEFEAGHADGAINIPLAERTGPNPDFVHVMKTLFQLDAKLLLGCQVGGRSMRAAAILESFGFTDVSNVKGGFAGMRDPMGRLIDPGWEESGLPVETGAPEGRRYEDVAARAGVDL